LTQSVDSGKPNVGFIGLGRMGNGMAKNILRSGYPLHVWNRSPQKCDELAGLGAKVAPTPRKLAEECQVIISMLATPAATEEVILGLGDWKGIGVTDGLSQGKTVVDMSTNLPSVATKLAGEVRAAKGDFVDAPVMGSVVPASQGTLTILAGGRREAVDELRPVLETMGKKIWYIGGNGSGCSMKLTMNLHLNLMVGGFAESLTFGAKAGLDPALIIEIWNNSILKTYITDTKGKKVLERDWSPAFALELAFKDIHLASEVAREVSAPIPLGAVVKQLYSAAVANGGKDLDFCALVTTYEQLGNLKVSKPRTNEPGTRPN
jgi:3-hydroxyisobutyrate dehydrogenase